MSSERRTAVDFLALIVNPVLVMMMVGSLAFLLQESFYRGDFPMRLRWVSGLFVFAAVLIAWITIEMGRTRAGLYLSPLLILGVIALNRFVESHVWGIPALTSVFHVIVVVSVWLVCHHVMLDCLLLDEGAALPSGRGLLDEWSQKTESTESAGRGNGSRGEFDATASGTSASHTISIFMDRIYPDRPQGPPGRTVLYVLLGGLLVIAAAGLNGPAQGTVIYAASYVVAGLGLLMTTHLLQLRLYLRRRGIAMPDDAVRGWVTVGSAIVVGAVLLAWLLPKPAVPTWSWGVYLTSPLRKASSWAARTVEPADTPDREGATAAPPPSSQKAAAEPSSGEGRDAEQPSDVGKGNGGSKREGDPSAASGGTKQHHDNNQTGAKHDDERPPKEAANAEVAKRDGNSQTPSHESSSADSGSSRSGGRPPSERSEDSAKNGEAGEAQHREGKSHEPSGDAQDNRNESFGQGSERSLTESGSETHRSRETKPAWRLDLTQVSSSLAWLFRLLVSLGFLLVVAWLAWRYRHEIWEVLRQWWEQLARLLESVFGRRRTPNTEEPPQVLTSPKVPPFASFQDPFASGAAARQSPVWLVVYSFDALQAWGEELGVPRDPDETPKEYARRLRASDLAGPADFNRLCELYNLVAYAGRSGTITLSAEDRHALAAAWRYMSRRVQEATTAGRPATAD